MGGIYILAKNGYKCGFLQNSGYELLISDWESVDFGLRIGDFGLKSQVS